MKLPPHVEVLDGGTYPWILLDLSHKAEKYIIVDAVKANGKPGSVYRLEFKKPKGKISPFFAHSVSLEDVLETLALLGWNGRIIIFGVEPESIEIGIGLTETVKASIPKVLNAIMEEIECVSESP